MIKRQSLILYLSNNLELTFLSVIDINSQYQSQDLFSRIFLRNKNRKPIFNVLDLVILNDSNNKIFYILCSDHPEELRYNLFCSDRYLVVSRI